MPEQNIPQNKACRAPKLSKIPLDVTGTTNRETLVSAVATKESGQKMPDNVIRRIKPITAPSGLDKAYHARLEFNRKRGYIVGPVEALSPYVKEKADEALDLTARFCQVLDRDMCVEVHRVPFSEADLRRFEREALRAGYRGRSVLRYVPNNISWKDLARLPADIRLPFHEMRIPQLPTNAPLDDDLGVLNGCWYLHIPRTLYLSAGKTHAEQRAMLPGIAWQLGAHKSLITMGDAADMVFLFALEAFNREIENREPEAIRTFTGAGAKAHACVVYSSAAVQLDWWEDAVRAPFLGIAPPLV